MFSSIAQSATVTTGATQVFSTTGLSAGTSDVIIVNAGPSDIYVSGSSSAGTSGFPVPANSQLVVTGPAVNLWAVTSAGTAQVTGTLGSDLVITALQDALMVTCGVSSTAAQVFDLYQYQGVAQTEAPLATLGPSTSRAVLTWPPYAQVWAGGPQVNPAGNLGHVVLVNSGASKIYAGGSGVTTLTGVPVAPGYRLLLRAKPPSAVYAICAGGATSQVITGLSSQTSLT